MDNVYSKTKRQLSLEYGKSVKDKMQREVRNREKINQLASLETKNRYNKFAQSGKFDSDMQRSIAEGAIKLKHIQHHEFRDRVKEFEREEKGGIYVQTQMEGKDRAQLEQDQFRAEHLDGDYYNQFPPTKSIKHWLRVREVAHEGPEIRFGLKERTENENIQEQIKQNMSIDHTEKSMKMVHFPSWKDNQKEKWALNQTTGQVDDFKTATNVFPLDKTVWDQKPIIIEGKEEEMYKDGNDAIGLEQTSRLRVKDLEWGRPEFVSTVKPDTWEDTLKYSKSIRTFKADQAFQAPDNYDLYSSNQMLGGSQTYKQTLVETKSIDRLVPFKHSQNINGMAMENLRPVNSKIYKLSLKQSGIPITQPSIMANSPVGASQMFEQSPQASPQVKANKNNYNFTQKTTSEAGFQSQMNTLAKSEQNLKLINQTQSLQNTQQMYPQLEIQNQKDSVKQQKVKPMSYFGQTSSSPKNSILKNSNYDQTQASMVSIGSIQNSQKQQNNNKKSMNSSKHSSMNQLPQLGNLNIANTKNFMPWEQPSHEDIQSIVGKYFQNKKSRQLHKRGTNLRLKSVNGLQNL